MTTLLIRLFSLLIDVFLIDFFFSRWSGSMRVGWRRVLIINGLFLAVIAGTILVPVAGQPVVNVLVSIGLLVTLAQQHHLTTSETVFFSIVFLAINFICEALATTLLSLLMPTASSSLLVIIMTTSLSSLFEIGVILGLRLLVARHDTYEQSLNQSIVLALSATPLFSILILASFLLTKLAVRLPAATLTLLLVIGVIGINISVIYLYYGLTAHLHHLHQVNLQNKALLAETKTITEIKKNQVALRSLRHDLKNQFVVLLGLLEQQRTADVKQHLEAGLNAISTDRQFYTNDLVLNYLLNEKHAEALQKKIEFNINVLMSADLRVDYDTLSILIGNLIDNALQATARIESPDSRKVTLLIKQFKGTLLIEITNPFLVTEKITRQARQTDGIGIQNIKRIVADHHGLYRQWDEDNRYCVSILLLDVVE